MNEEFHGLYMLDTQIMSFVQIIYLNIENKNIKTNGPFWIKTI